MWSLQPTAARARPSTGRVEVRRVDASHAHGSRHERTSEAKDSVDAVGWPCDVEAVEVNSRYGDRPEGIIARRRAGLLLIVLLLTSVVAVGGSLLWPEPATGDWYSYQDIAPVRELWWGLLTMLSVSLVLNVPAQAFAALLLTHGRGAMWTTVGAGLMWLGTGLYAVGVGGWAAIYFFGTHPGLDAASGTRLLDAVGDDPRLFAAALPGATLVALGTVVQAVGLWLSRAVPRWVPILSLTIVLTFIVPGSGVIGALAGIPIAIAGIALGYYAWRQAALVTSPH
jgi:hypothetical protein